MHAQSPRGQEQGSLIVEMALHSHRPLPGQPPPPETHREDNRPRDGDSPAVTRASLVESGSFRSQHSLLPWHRAMLRWPWEHPGMDRATPWATAHMALVPYTRLPSRQGTQRQGQSALKAAPRLEGSRAPQQTPSCCKGALSAAPCRLGTQCGQQGPLWSPHDNQA